MREPRFPGRYAAHDSLQIRRYAAVVTFNVAGLVAAKWRLFRKQARNVQKFRH